MRGSRGMGRVRGEGGENEGSDRKRRMNCKEGSGGKGGGWDGGEWEGSEGEGGGWEGKEVDGRV